MDEPYTYHVVRRYKESGAGPFQGFVRFLACHAMTFKYLRIIGFIAFYVVTVEVALEVHANMRGWNTLLLGTHKATLATASSHGPSYGPTTEFPFRSRIVPSEKLGGTFRYWIASSSHAEDLYVEPAAIFPSVLESLLQQHGVKATVLNAGVAGRDIGGNAEHLHHLAPTWKPDVVILYQMSLTITQLSKRLLGGKGMYRKKGGEKAESGAGLSLDWGQRMIEATTVYAKLKGHVTGSLGTMRVLSNGLGQKGETAFEQEVQDFVRAVREDGAVPVLCTFATSHTRKDLPHFPYNVVTGIFRYNSYLSLEGWVTTVERFNDIIRQIGAREGILVVDLEREIAGNSEYFRDFVHFTPKGHEAVAVVMSRRLLESGVSVVSQ